MKPNRFRILSYNIHQGQTAYRRQIGFSLLKEAIKSQKPDIVILQEVAGLGGGTKKSKSVPLENTSSFQFEALVDELWPYGAYGKNAIFTGGFHGNAVLSRFAIVKEKNTDISIKNMIRRGMLHVEIEHSTKKPHLHIIATHLGLLQIERDRQLKKIVQYVQKNIPEDSPFILGGDFNDWREKITPKLVKQLAVEEAYWKLNRRHARTFPSQLPVLKLDRIYFKNLKVHNIKRPAGRPWILLSDHLPLVAEFSI